MDAEVLVVGAGVAGLEVATEAARRGMDVLLVDEEPQPGGLLVWQPRSAITDRHANGALAIVGELVARARAAGVRWLPNTCVVGVYDDVALCDAEDGPRLLRFRRIVVATGTHEGAVDAVDADAPAVFGTRAAARLLAYGVLVGDAVVVAGEGAWTRAVAEALRDAGARVEGPHALEALRAVRTRGGRVRGAVLELDGATRTVECDAVVVGPPPSAAYELAAQAGARVVFDGRRFVVQADDEGRTGIARLFAVGACTGRDTVEEALAQARRAATVLAEGGTT
ncbi:MAG: NAD(P)/FAD-dependent oxidoreductase [Myxococcota bacterium]|nr:NAD(P)/FAD-dependent oxidoreductase [Myxococcota bacterium]